jgi:asparagine synthase (glutamine-hydrolysing)
MCGIVGIASQHSIAARAWLAAGSARLRHRGPDDSGEWWSSDGHAGLAHRRLAIVDLTPAGHQPMLREPALSIVFNGEIYNFQDLKSELTAAGHTFVSDSDTEVILAAYATWGTACLARLNGMFAFALYDAQRRQLFLARDRAGEKPLFYALAGGTIRFASELKALLADETLPRRVDAEALDCYLADGFVPGDRCILQGMQKLPPAHALLFDVNSGTARVWRYWELPVLAASAAHGRIDEGALLDELEERLANAVARQLVADVPVGVLLSGGVDSSLVTAMAARAVPAVKTFTVRFPGYGSHDETEHARLIARHFGTTHVEVEGEAIDIALLPLLARQFDEPMNDSSMVPTYLLSRVVRQHCTVALGGDGGDELFGGYPHYDRMLWMQKTLGSVPMPVRAAVARTADNLLPVGFKGRNWLQGVSTDFGVGVPSVAQMFDRGAREQLLGGSVRRAGVAERIREAQMPATDDLLQRATRLDFGTYLAEDILVKVDRASMLSSLEVRAPLLEQGMLEFAFGRVPSHLKTTAGSRKILLKRLATRLLPKAFDTHRKQGFSIPLSSWIRSGRWQLYFREILLDPGQRWLERGLIEQMLAGESQTRSNAERLFGLVLLELWRREYRVEIPA